MTNSVDPDQTAPIGAVCSGSTLFASIDNSSVMLGNYLQQTTFSDTFFFLDALRVSIAYMMEPDLAQIILSLPSKWEQFFSLGKSYFFLTLIMLDILWTTLFPNFYPNAGFQL